MKQYNYKKTGKSLLIDLPMAYELPRKTIKDKRVSLSLNSFRKKHPRETSEVKKLVEKAVSPQIPEGFYFENPVVVDFILVKKDLRIYDSSNWFAQGAKLLYDCLQDIGVLLGDDDEYIYDQHIHKSVLVRRRLSGIFIFSEVEPVKQIEDEEFQY